jgi:acetylornithine deacetylase
MTIPIDTITEHLRHLVAQDTSDPVTTITKDHPILAYAARVLEDAGCTVIIEDFGAGCVNLLAVRGDPTTLFNCHLDTVKPNPNWTKDPFELSIDSGRAYGLGTTDIKGAGACMLGVAQSTDAPIAILFTTDEEAGKGHCVETFLDSQRDRWARAVVAEPTNATVVLQHRGYTSFELTFHGTAGHTSGADASLDSAIHKALQWGSQALTLAQPGAILDGARFNIGLAQGGSASNVIAADAILRFGFRPLPTPDAPQRTKACIQALLDLLPTDGSTIWTDRFVAPALVRDESMVPIVESWGIELGDDVDFWTEAALFAVGGVPAVVLGPGNIAQAHSSDEYVELAQLELCANAYASIVSAESAALTTQGGAHAP